MGISRRKFMGSAAAGLVAASGVAPAFSQSRARVRWNMPTSWPPRLLLQDSATMFAEKLAELTDGEFQIRVRPAGELVPPLEVFNAVQSGTVECGHSWSGYLLGTNSALILDGGIPFGMTAEQHASWIRDGGGAEMLDEVFAEFNVKSFLVGDIGGQLAGWFNQEINGIDDLRGLRARIAGLSGQMYEPLGVSVQMVPYGETYTALERGVIDAVSGGTPTDNVRVGFHEVTRYAYYPGWAAPHSAMSLYVNRGEWDSLPDDFKAAFESAAVATHGAHVTHCQNADRESIEDIKNGDYDVEFRPLPEEVMTELAGIQEDFMERFVDEDPDFARIYPEWRRFADGIRDLQDMTVYPINRHRNERG